MIGRPDPALAAFTDALREPDRHAELLADALNDRGLRDAFIVVAARTGGWDELAAAARAGGRAAAATGRSVYGPLAVLGVAHWILGQDQAAAQLLAAVPPTDPAHRMAGLAQRLVARGTDPAACLRAVQGLRLSDCIAYTGRPAPEPSPPPPGLAEHWFGPPPQDGPPQPPDDLYADDLHAGDPLAADPPTAEPRTGGPAR